MSAKLGRLNLPFTPDVNWSGLASVWGDSGVILAEVMLPFYHAACQAFTPKWRGIPSFKVDRASLLRSSLLLSLQILCCTISGRPACSFVTILTRSSQYLHQPSSLDITTQIEPRISSIWQLQQLNVYRSSFCSPYSCPRATISLSFKLQIS